MNILSLFDGISCLQIALEILGIKVNKYFSSEIDKYATQVTQKNYPDTIQLGDITQIKVEDLPKIDLICGGSPCQGFSFAGKQLNFKDPRSALFFEFVRLLKEIKPKYFLLENVKMKKEHQDIISKCLGVEPILINSALLSAQNRKRLYWTNIPNVTQPEDKKIFWKDVREYGVNSENFYYTQKALEWIEKHGYRKNKKLKVHEDYEKMQMIEASHSKKYSSQRFFGILDDGIDNFKQRKFIKSVVEKNNVIPFECYEKVLNENFAYRYITPLECERLQTIPDNYTDCISNTQRYKSIGNSFTVDVIAHILKNIKK